MTPSMTPSMTPFMTPFMTPPSSPCIVTFLMEWNKIAAPALHYNFEDAIALYKEVRLLFGAWLYNSTGKDPDVSFFNSTSSGQSVLNIPEVETFRQGYDSWPEIRVLCHSESVVFTGLDKKFKLHFEDEEFETLGSVQQVYEETRNTVPLIEAPENDLLRIIEVFVFETVYWIIRDWKSGRYEDFEVWLNKENSEYHDPYDEIFTQYLRYTYDLVNARLMKDRFIIYASAFKNSLVGIVPGA